MALWPLLETGEFDILFTMGRAKYEIESNSRFKA